MKKKIFSIIFTLIIIQFSFGQSSDDFHLSFEMKSLPDGGIDKYILKNDCISVYREIFFKDDTLKLIYESNFKNKNLYSIDSLFNKLKINELESRYENIVIDGTHLEFYYKYKTLEKVIYLDNYELNKITELLKFINSFLPKEYQTISK